MADNDPDQALGLYRKYQVNKVIVGTDQRGDATETLLPLEEQCFVLAEHDPVAPHALYAYANVCAHQFPKLAADLREMADRWHADHSKEQ